MKGLNNTFRGASPTWANACVGNNGFVDYWTYSTGFSKAANLLIETVLADKGSDYQVDHFIYPVCFNMRHSVELRLKGAIEKLQEIAKIKDQKIEFDFNKSHDIGLIWKFFRSKSEIIDDRYETLNDRVQSIISDIAEIDPSGQTFRYPLNTDSQKHLIEVSVINFLNLYKAFKKLEINLENIKYLGDYLLDEYGQGTFTAHLSRFQISKIAKCLPPKDDWILQSSTEKIENIRVAYDLSKRELSKVINLIKVHYEFAPEISLNVPLLGLDEDELILFLDESFARYGVKYKAGGTEINDLSNTARLFEEIKHDSEITSSAYKKLEPKLSLDYLAGLNALFYFARELDFSENYIRIFNIEYKNLQLKMDKPDQVEQEFMHLFDKTNAIYNILQTLFFLKHDHLAERIVIRYKLQDKFSWLDEARSREKFQKPSYTAY